MSDKRGMRKWGGERRKEGGKEREKESEQVKISESVLVSILNIELNPMDRGAWQAAVHGVTRVRHYFESKLPPEGHMPNS